MMLAILRERGIRGEVVSKIVALCCFAYRDMHVPVVVARRRHG